MRADVKHGYNSERRREGSAETRRRILSAARELFLAQGYRSTTIAAIAARASVNVDTVYQLAGRKPMLMRELIEEAISGTDHPMAAEQRRYVREIRAEPDPARKLRIYARAVRRIQERMAPLFIALRDAASTEPEARQVWGEISERRADNMRLLINDIRDANGLRPGLSIQAAADTIWVMSSSDVYVLLTVDRGWSPRRFEHWLAESWHRLILTEVEGRGP
ncbi:MAG: TetR family transcriptional regulator [Candidatus Dormibacteraeota bacterium]|uniref:TetR family transcriptional regulator n=1 Tax=Candidatus Amunia macphersoniae TaxID=3127014 RepID=A0A934KGJ8_9BACT|nr:TetR family transcriptional regulator [Candidatus Dormibacteraeota bacterium]